MFLYPSAWRYDHPFPILSLTVLQVPSDEPSRLNDSTLEQILNRLGLQQYLATLQAENLDPESLVTHI